MCNNDIIFAGINYLQCKVCVKNFGSFFHFTRNSRSSYSNTSQFLSKLHPFYFVLGISSTPSHWHETSKFLSLLLLLSAAVETWWKRIYKNLKQRQINFVKSQCDQFQLKKFIWFTKIASKFLLITPPSSIKRNDIETDLSRCWRGYRYDKAYMHTHSTYKKD